jgi:hypothetical protein
MAILRPCNYLFAGNCVVVAVVFTSDRCSLKFSMAAVAAQELEKNKK